MMPALLVRQIDPLLPARSWPTTSPGHMPDAIRDTVEAACEALRDNVDHVVVEFENTDVDDHTLTTAAWNLFTLIGEPIPQYASGELIYPIAVDASVEKAGRYSSSRVSGGFHTDGTVLPRPPDFASLVGLSSADVGGETVLIDGVELCRRLDELDTGHVDELASPHHFDARGHDLGTVTKQQPIVTRRGDRFELRYLRREIEQGYTAVEAAVPTRLRAAMDLLDAASADTNMQIPVTLRRGTMLLWNNHRFLHGRLPFEEHRSRRRLQRIFGVFRDDR